MNQEMKKKEEEALQNSIVTNDKLSTIEVLISKALIDLYESWRICSSK